MKNRPFHLSSLMLFLCILSSNLLAQKSDVTFGKIKKSDFEIQTLAGDSSISAIVMYDYGHSYFQFDERNMTFRLVHDRFCRIKILNKNGYDWADVSIPFNRTMYEQEKINGLKAYTYNLANGKISKEKISKSAIFVEEVTSTYSKMKFTMPNVKEGSIIEYKYTINSENPLYFKDWQFQYTIPVLWSEFITEIPEYYTYSSTFGGYEQLYISDEKMMDEQVSYIQFERKDQQVGKTTRGMSSGHEKRTLSFQKMYKRFVMKDIPAFKIEDHISSYKNYLSKVDYELVRIAFPNSAPQTFTKTWESVNKLLLENDGFGRQISNDIILGGAGFMKEAVELIKSKTENPIERMNIAFEYIKGKLLWNGENRLFVSKNLRKTYTEEKGNSADINLLLLLLLRNLDIDVLPVALSTRDNGIIHPTNPSILDMNYVIAMVTIDGKNYLLDATESINQINMLAPRCLNGQGRIIDMNRSEWVSLYTKLPGAKMIMNDLKITNDGMIQGVSQASCQHYAAREIRCNIAMAGNKDEYAKLLEEKWDGLKIQESSIENIDKLNKPVIEKYTLSIANKLNNVGNLIYFTPMLFDQIHENPFKMEERKYPVDFAYKRNKTVINKFTIPDGYTLDEKPKNIALTLPGNGAKFTYSISQVGNSIQVISKFIINNEMFFADDYATLKSFYNQVIAKHSEQIVLRKVEL